MNISFAPLRRDAVDYLSANTGIDFHYGSFMPPNWFCVTARDDEGHIAGVLACEFLSWFEVRFNTVITDQRCMSRKLLRAIFTALFSQAVRITADVDPNNLRAVNQMRRMGFVYEGFCRRGLDGHRDALLFGMLKEDCRYLPDYAGGRTLTMEMPYGQAPQDTRSVSNGAGAI